MIMGGSPIVTTCLKPRRKRGMGAVGPMPSTVPSSIGFPDYQSFFNAATAGLPDCTNQGFPDSACVAAKGAFINQVNAEWTGNPKNCHAIVCDATGNPAPSVSTTPVTVSKPLPPAPQQVVNPSPSTQLTTTGTSATSTTSAVSQANGTTASTGNLVSTIAGYLSPTSTDWISGVPNWIVVAGGGLLAFMALAIMTRK